MNNTIWTIIDNYFENKKNNLSLTQLDSYNAFLNLQISKTIRQFNPIEPELVSKGMNIKLIIGGSYDDDTGSKDEGISLKDEPDIKNDGKGILIEYPTKKNKDEHTELYPNECRLKNLTYTCELKCDVFIIVSLEGSYHLFKQEKISVGRIPVMLHSQLCNLYNKTPNILKQVGECQYDQGGYFIIDGKEKVIIAQERQVENQIYTTEKKNDEYIEYESEIRSVKEGSFEPARVTKLHFFKNNTIKVTIPGFLNPVPLFVLFRFLGIVSDKDITTLIVNDFENEMELKILDILYYSILDSKYINNENLAVDFISKDSSSFESKFFIYKNFIPHVGYDDKISKAHFLAYMTRELILTKLNYMKPTNKDSFIHKRIDISGFLVGTIFRDLYFRIVNKIKENVNKKIALDGEMTEILPLQFRNSIIPRKIIDEGLLYAFKNCWGLKDMKGGKCKQGIVQDLNRLNYVGYISHINRINMPLSDSAKIREPHSLHASSFGGICPYETPDGGSIGLRKNLSILTKVSFDISSNSLLQVLEDLRVITIYDLSKKKPDYCIIFVNERIYGYYDKPAYLDYKLRLLRRNAIINIYTSIVWNKIDNIIKINTDSGRLLRPIFVINNEIKTELINGIRYKDNKNTLDLLKITEDIESNTLNWNNLIKGYLHSREEENIDYNDKYLYANYLPQINELRQAVNVEKYENI